MTAWDLLFGRYLCFFRGIFPLSSAIKVFFYFKVGLKLNTQVQASSYIVFRKTCFVKPHSMISVNSAKPPAYLENLGKIQVTIAYLDFFWIQFKTMNR